jgi:hypothetical protein
MTNICTENWPCNCTDDISQTHAAASSTASIKMSKDLVMRPELPNELNWASHCTLRRQPLGFTADMSSSWDANSRSHSQQILRLTGNPNLHYRVHKSSPLAPTLSQIHPVHTLHLLP